MVSTNFEGQEIKAFLGDGTRFKGVLRFNGTVRLDGFLEGKIITDGTLIIGEKAHLVAELSVGTLISLGKIEGNIKASQKIEIRAKSELIGNIITPKLFVEEGASFEGQCEMSNKRKKTSDNVVHLESAEESSAEQEEKHKNSEKAAV